jgi:DnaK suppressor protein
MNSKKLPIYESKLQEILKELVGGVEKSIKSGREESVEPAADISDGATQAYSRQLMSDLGEQEWQKLKQVEDALGKIKSGQYGTCNRCEEPIPEARLEIVPFAQYCVQCLSEIEKEKELEDSRLDFDEESLA